MISLGVMVLEALHGTAPTREDIGSQLFRKLRQQSIGLMVSTQRVTLKAWFRSLSQNTSRHQFRDGNWICSLCCVASPLNQRA